MSETTVMCLEAEYRTGARLALCDCQLAEDLHSEPGAAIVSSLALACRLCIVTAIDD